MIPADIQSLVDRLLIRELIDEYSNVVTQKCWDRLPELFVEDCAWRTRGSNFRDIVGRGQVVEAIIAVVKGYRMVFQMPHAPRILLEGDTASATTLMNEVIKVDDETGRLVLAVYKDAFVRTAEGWKFKERVFQGSYLEPCAMPGRVVLA